MTVPMPTFRRTRRLVVGFAIAALAVSTWSSVAHAHTDFVSSDPSDQSIVDGPLAEVTVSFTNPAEPSGSGFELLDPSGVVQAPTSVDTIDGTDFVLGFDPPLTAGTYGVRWKVQAGDAHPIDGSFQFEVVVPAPSTAPDPTPTTTVAAAVVVSDADDSASDSSGSADSTTSESLDEFLASDTTADGGAAVGRFGRALTFAGTIFGIGTLAALIWVISGRRDEIRSLTAWIRLAGLAIAVGGLVELAALELTQTSEVTALLDTKAGLATVLKLIGGLAVWFGFSERAGRLVAPARSLSAAAVTGLRPGATETTPATQDEEFRWSPTKSASPGFVGFALVLASFSFDGHTVSKGPWAVHSLVNLVHVGAAAVWAGGVFAMTMVAWLRRRRSDRVGLAAMVVRFSTLATISLAAVTVAGLTMTFMIIDTPGDLVSTDWGQVLLIKTAAVSIAVGIGAYNHFRLRPALERSPDDPELARELRVSLSIESVVFAVVVLLTAWLVAAAT